MKTNNTKKQSTFTQTKEEQEKLKSRPEVRNGRNGNYISRNKENVNDNKNANKPTYQKNIYEEEEDFLRESRTSKNKNSNHLLIGSSIIILILLILVAILLFSKNNADNKGNIDDNQSVNTEMTETEEDDYDGLEESENPEEGTTLENSFETGDSNIEAGKYEEGVLTKTTPEYYSSTDYLKDLNGYEIPAVYTIQNITYDVAHVNYQSKRATIDEGMEFYWLEIDYNGKKYRTQCSYNMFRNLDTEGICKVAVEILTLDSGQQVVSYMKVVSEDYTKEDAENDYNF